ncbi:MAG TPA: SMP-30/gluconolactonase/LRE family protein [Verrucomicrobiota bacterium]|nr:SMP-30/gluconolactonase/LRE family protein [Verrucomicrobiota bacterium]
MIAECVLKARAVLGEGPVWHEGRLLWVDIERGEIHQFDPATRVDRHWSFPHRLGFVVPSVRGDFVVGTDQGLARFEVTTGALTHVATPEPNLPGNRFNDAKCDPAGRLWAGTMSVSEEPERGTLYCIESSWHTQPMVRSVSISNGLAWSPDGRTLYYIDSPTRRVDAFDFDPATGEISKRRTVIEVTDGFPDGMAADNQGRLWVAIWGGGCVACFDPRNGSRLATISVPARDVTSCCFGEADELYITTASRDLDPAGRQQQPLAGGVFRARVGAGGLPIRCFEG